jgi:type I restriction enzyme M protein
MFYNTGISTYVWIVSNRKPKQRKGKVQLIDASGFWQKMRKSLGSKRKELGAEHIEDITRLFGDFKEVTKDGVPISRIFKNEDFGYRTITVERPERDEGWQGRAGDQGQTQGQAAARCRPARHRERPAREDVEEYFKREVLPHARTLGSTTRRRRSATRFPSTATSTCSSRRVPLAEIDAELKTVTDKILN